MRPPSSRAATIGLDVEVEAFGAIDGPLVWSGGELAWRRTGKERAVARIRNAPVGSFAVRAAGARAVVPASEQREVEGLSADADFAAALARVSGGTLWIGEAPASKEGRSPAVHATLLAAVAMLLVHAWWRGRS
ncbi:MAG: hypothetical protein AAGD14_02640 [Planctomycetota bacterium]